jgi:hypothetical protein
VQLPGFTVLAPNDPARQVVMLQQADTSTNNLGWQRYYHGTNLNGALLATHGRGVSVWPAATPADTRIAICGESQDQVLPLTNTDADGWPGAGGPGSAGFVAMFDGAGNLLWSHHFFGVAPGQHCAITDVSVRVEYVNGVPTTDFVTFCGVSTYGMPAANATLTASQPYAATVALCPNSAAGNTNNGAGQWDGIVGRLSRAHNGAGPATAQFLSSVGGAQQDGLFGIADLDAERFVVVGSTSRPVGGPAGADFPVTNAHTGGPGTCVGPGVAPYSAGVVAVFRAVTGSPLVLDSSQLIGRLSAGESRDTAVRDVLVQPNWGQGGEPGVIVVGATTDAQALLPGSLGLFAPVLSPQAAFGGGVDGFVLTGLNYPGGFQAGVPFAGQTVWIEGTFRGGLGNEGLTGVQGWNEFYDHFVVTGTLATQGIDVASYFHNAGPGLVQIAGGVVAPGLGGAPIGGALYDRPTAVAVPQGGAPGTPPMFNATTAGGFVEFGLDNPAGGGVSVDASGRAHVVGTTISADFPVPGGRPKTGTTHDAVRVALDMLPVGVGRTDGTASLPLPAGGLVYPLPGVFGGTTPECALTPFGHQIGLTDPQLAPAAPRMLIDWEGLAPAANVIGAVLVSRPPVGSGFNAAALQFGFPGDNNPLPPGPLPLLPDGVLLWTTNSSAILISQPLSGPNALRIPLSQLPTPPIGGTITVSVQLICLVLPVAGGGLGPICPVGGQSNYVASPAMWLNW